jgi:hypothetical protein
MGRSPRALRPDRSLRLIMRGAPIYFWAWRMGFQPQAEGSRLSQARRLNSRGRVKTRPRG